MLGSASTQSVFASATSIAIVPKLWAEWNYNMFNQPYVINSMGNLSATAQTSGKLGGYAKFKISLDPSNWTAGTDGAKAKSLTDYRKTQTYNSSSALQLTVNNSSYTNNLKTATFNSPIISLPYTRDYSTKTSTTYPGQLGYRKIVFYAKISGTINSDIIAASINPTLTNNVAYVTTSGSSRFAYMVIGQGKNVSKSNEPWSFSNFPAAFNVIETNDGDVSIATATTPNPATVLSTVDASYGRPKLVWNVTSDTAATSYKIYRQKTAYKKLGSLSWTAIPESSQTAEYVTTIAGATAGTQYQWVDYLYYTYGSGKSATYRPNSSYDGTVTVRPTVKALNSINDSNYDQIFVPTLVRSYDSETGQQTFNSTSIKLDSDVWTKIEVWFGLLPYGKNGYNIPTSIQLQLDVDAEYDSTNIVIDQMEMFAISEDDYLYHKAMSPENAFKAFRPGETQTNLLLPSSDRLYQNVAKPASFISQSKSTFSTSTTPVQLVTWTPYSYYSNYVNNTGTANVLQAFYDSYLSINKIVVKVDVLQSTWSSASINIYQRSNYSSSAVTTIALGAGYFSACPVFVLYYNNSASTWSTSSWTAPPQLSASGTVTSNEAMTEVDGIELVVANPGADGKNLGIVEFSPRLEIDLSNILESIDVKKDLTSQQNDGFPFSYINSNSSNITLSNIPVYKSDGYPSTIFENDSKNSAFYNLLRQGIKFTAFLESPSFQKDVTEKIPMFTMYANDFSINDLSTISINAYDSTKAIMQANYSPQTLITNSNLSETLASYLDSCGFSDYDKPALDKLASQSSQKIIFWTDNNKSIFENLQDILIAFQVGAWVDEYGILRFKSLKQVFDNYNLYSFTPDFAVTDIASAGYIANIIPDTFSQNIGERIGSVKINYKVSQNNYSPLVVGGSNSASSLPGQIAGVTFPKAEVWTQEQTSALSQLIVPYTNNGLSAFNPYYLYVNPKITDTKVGGTLKNALLLSDTLIVDGEILSYDSTEYQFMHKVGATASVMKRAVYNAGSIDEAIEDYLVSRNWPASKSASVYFSTTGNMLGVQRGLYGTPVPRPNRGKYIPSTIKVGTGSLTNSAVTQAPIDNYNNIALSTSLSSNQVNMILPVAKDKGYSFYYMSFTPRPPAGPTTPITEPNKAIGMMINVSKTGYTGTATDLDATKNLFVEIRSTGTTTQSLYLYTISSTGAATILDTKPIVGKNMFSGYAQSMAVLLNNDGTITVYLNTSPYTLNRDGANSWQQYPLGKNLFANGDAGSPDNAGRYWGIYTRDWASSTTVRTFYVGEWYARTVPRGLSDATHPTYHWFSSTIMSYLLNYEVALPIDYDYYSAGLNLRSIDFYDVKFGHTTTGNVEMIPTSFAGDTDFSAVSASNFHGGFASNIPWVSTNNFNTRFLLMPETNTGLVWIKDTKNDNVETLKILGNYIVQNSEETIIKTINPNNTRIVELTTDWFRDSSQAETVIDAIAKASQGFHVDINVSINGNPLIQVGDFAKITYKLKRVGYDPTDTTVKPLVCLVTSVSYAIDNQGMGTTTLKLKPMITSKMV